MSTESRGRLEQRLQREGRWEAFTAYKEELKSTGLSGSEAYQRAVAEFAKPLPVEGGAGLVPQAVFDGKTVPSRAAVEWVAKHLQVAELGPEDAPSGEAWSLLAWARSDAEAMRDFWKSVYPKILPSKAQIEADDATRGDDGRDLYDLISRVEKEQDDGTQ